MIKKVNEYMYTCFYISGEVVAALMVGDTSEHQQSSATSVVRLFPFVGAPHLHYMLPAFRMRDAPIKNHLQKIKYTTYEKIKLNIFNIDINVLYLLTSTG